MKPSNDVSWSILAVSGWNLIIHFFIRLCKAIIDWHLLGKWSCCITSTSSRWARISFHRCISVILEIERKKIGHLLTLGLPGLKAIAWTAAWCAPITNWDEDANWRIRHPFSRKMSPLLLLLFNQFIWHVDRSAKDVHTPASALHQNRRQRENILVLERLLTWDDRELIIEILILLVRWLSDWANRGQQTRRYWTARQWSIRCLFEHFVRRSKIDLFH